MNLLLSAASQIPIYEQLREQIKGQLFCGGLQPGDKLPSIRALAKDLKVSFLTVNRVYEELEQEGILENQQGRGCFVRPLSGDVLQTIAEREVVERLKDVLEFAKTRGLSTGRVKQLLNAWEDEVNE